MDKSLNSDDMVDLAEEHHKAGRPQEAELYYRKALELDPGHPGALYYLANIAYDDGRLAFARQLIEELIRDEPSDAEALHLLGMVALKEKDYSRAIECLTKALDIQPAYVQACYSLGDALNRLGEFDEALENFQRAVNLKADFSPAYESIGKILLSQGRWGEAITIFRKAINENAGTAPVYAGLGVAQVSKNENAAAVVSFERAIALKPDFVEAYSNRGVALNNLRRYEEALVCCDDAIAFKSDYAAAYYNRGNALRELKRYDEALFSYEKAFALKPDCEFLLGILLHTKMMVCDWQGLGESIKRYEADIRSSKKITAPFPVLALLDSPEIQKFSSQTFVETKYPKVEYLGVIKKRAKGEKIRVGYYSADFHNHPVTYLTAELFEVHSRDRFEIFGFSFGSNTNDEMRQRVSSAFDKFIDVRDMSDIEIASLSRDLNIDIAVDLGGHTQNARTGMFAIGCSPIQVNYIGYPGTMGANYIDYLIADKTVIPVEAQSNFTENIVYLPHSFQVNDSKRKISDRVFTKQELDLPEAGFVFCCFNNSYKISPATFDIWMRILKAVEGSILWLFENNPTAAKNLRKEAETRGVDGGRLVFANGMAYADYLARCRSANLFLDTLPYNAGTTASDALWAGLPVLTCKGKSFASRMAASLLSAIELPELITHTEAEYEAKAIELASNAEKLSALKRKLEKNRLTTPLFNAKLFARHIESAYEAMYDRYQAGLAPESIEVKARDQ